MADVLGKYSFLDTPDVNGNLVLLEGDAAQTINGTANQISVTGTNPTLTLSLADNPVVPGTGSLTLPSGTTAQRPGSPTAAMTRYNTTLSSLEFYDGSAWQQPSGKLLQVVSGTISSVSSNSRIPYDNTTPTSGEGVQLWTQSFTPLRSDSTIVITTNGFYAVNSAADVYCSGAVFNGTTNIYAQLLGFTTNTGNGFGFAVIATETSGSTTARTYSFRAGPNTNVTVFYMQGTAGQAYGSATNSGRYIIQEIAP